MTSADIERIEAELSICLPSVYREAVLDYPVNPFSGNSEVMFWDDPDALIAYNLALRAGEVSFVDAWPTRFYALGMDDSGCADVLDLKDELSGVYWFDRSHVSEAVDMPSEEKFIQWLARQTEEMREYLSELGVSLESSPDERRKKEAEQGNGFVWVIFLFLAILLVGILLTILRR